MYLTIEGNDGSGKGLAHETVRKYFEDKKFKVYSVREPGNVDDIICMKIRELLVNAKYANIHPLTEHYLYMADRAQNVNMYVVEKLKQGYIVVQDRGIDSTTAYQAYGNGMDHDMIAKNQHDATNGITPNLTIMLDVSPDIGLKRVSNDNKRQNEDFDETKFEDRGLTYMEKVHEGYRQIAKDNPDRVRVVDASQSPEKVQSDIIKSLDAYLKEVRERNM